MARLPNPTSKDVVKVLPLQRESQLEARPGRPRKLKMPPMPQEVLDGMTTLERDHYDFFIHAITQDYSINKPSDFIALHMAALEYVNLLRVQAKQLTDGEVITAARQHPGVQLRAWLDSLSTTRKARKEQGGGSEGDAQRVQWERQMAKLSS